MCVFERVKDHESEGGRTSLMRAAKNGHQLTVEFLVSKGLSCCLLSLGTIAA